MYGVLATGVLSGFCPGVAKNGVGYAAGGGSLLVKVGLRVAGQSHDGALVPEHRLDVSDAGCLLQRQGGRGSSQCGSR